jgi:hypothetical protein
MQCLADCDEQDEDSMHLFFACAKSVVRWQHTGLWQSILTSLDNSIFTLNVFAVLQHLDGQEKHVFGVTLWNIWKNRNNKVWNDIRNLQRPPVSVHECC